MFQAWVYDERGFLEIAREDGIPCDVGVVCRHGVIGGIFMAVGRASCDWGDCRSGGGVCGDEVFVWAGDGSI